MHQRRCAPLEDLCIFMMFTFMELIPERLMMMMMMMVMIHSVCLYVY